MYSKTVYSLGAGDVSLSDIQGMVRHRAATYAVAFVITGLAALIIDLNCLVESRFINVWDLSSHYSWSVGFIKGIQAGYLYPRWSADSNLGLGEPSFYYYAPLTYYACAAVNALVGSAWLSLRIAAFLANWATGLIVFGFAFTNRLPRALVGALAVQASPMFFLVLAFNAAFAWAFALPFYSLVLLLYARRSPGGPVSPGLAIAYAGLCLTHILSGFMVGLSLGAAEALWLIWNPTLSRVRASLTVGASLLLGIGLAGVYLMPAILALRYASPAAITAGPTLDWRTTFAFATVTALLYGVRWKLYQYAVATIVVLPLAAGALRSWSSRERDGIEARLLVAGAAAVVFATELSAPLWFLAKPLHFVQFSYRFLAPASVAGLLGCAWRLGHSARRETLVGVAIAATLVCLLGAEAKLAIEGRTIAFQGDMTRHLFSDPNMLPAAHGPDWRQYGQAGGFAGECGRLGLRCESLKDQPQERRWRILLAENVAGPVDVRLPAFAFPTWTVVVNGERQGRPADLATGALVARLTSRDNVVELRWSPLVEERLGWVVSTVAAAITLALLASAKLRRRGRRREWMAKRTSDRGVSAQ